MKEVVIKKEGFKGALLSPYWIKEFYKRKGIDIFIYYLKSWDDSLYINVTNDLDFLIKYEDEWDSFEYFSKDLGKEISFLNRDIYDIDGFVYARLETEEYTNREDKDLIAIAKETNDKKKIKVIEIPDDVQYEILEYECAIGEYIREISRTWE